MRFPGFDKVKVYFDDGFWTKEQVAVAVKCTVITASQYQEITGEAYI